MTRYPIQIAQSTVMIQRTDKLIVQLTVLASDGTMWAFSPDAGGRWTSIPNLPQPERSAP